MMDRRGLVRARKESVVRRRLVDTARCMHTAEDPAQAMCDSAFRFMSAMASLEMLTMQYPALSACGIGS